MLQNSDMIYFFDEPKVIFRNDISEFTTYHFWGILCWFLQAVQFLLYKSHQPADMLR